MKMLCIAALLAIVPGLVACNGSHPTRAVPVDVELMSVKGDETYIEAMVRVTGREDLGAYVQVAPAFVVFADGKRTFVSSSMTDPNEGRRVTLRFSGFESLARPMAIEIHAIHFYREPPGPGQREQPGSVQGLWPFPLTDIAAAAAATAVPVPDGSKALADLRAVLDQLLVSENEMVFRGHVEGLERGFVPSFTPIGSLTDASGAILRPSGGSWGFGTNSTRFEWRFSRPMPAVYTFELNVDAGGDNPSTRELSAAERAKLQSYNGLKVAWRIIVP